MNSAEAAGNREEDFSGAIRHMEQELQAGRALRPAA